MNRILIIILFSVLQCNAVFSQESLLEERDSEIGVLHNEYVFKLSCSLTTQDKLAKYLEIDEHQAEDLAKFYRLLSREVRDGRADFIESNVNGNDEQSDIIALELGSRFRDLIPGVEDRLTDRQWHKLKITALATALAHHNQRQHTPKCCRPYFVSHMCELGIDEQDEVYLACVDCLREYQARQTELFERSLQEATSRLPEEKQKLFVSLIGDADTLVLQLVNGTSFEAAFDSVVTGILSRKELLKKLDLLDAQHDEIRAVWEETLRSPMMQEIDDLYTQYSEASTSNDQELAEEINREIQAKERSFAVAVSREFQQLLLPEQVRLIRQIAGRSWAKSQKSIPAAWPLVFSAQLGLTRSERSELATAAAELQEKYLRDMNELDERLYRESRKRLPRQLQTYLNELDSLEDEFDVKLDGFQDLRWNSIKSKVSKSD